MKTHLAKRILKSGWTAVFLCLLAETCHGSVSATLPKAATRTLQTTTPKYSVTYAGYFQIFQHSTCSSPSPVLVGYCRGGDIEFISASDPSISCSPSAAKSDETWNALECTNSCASDTECQNVYLTTILGGIFGEILFKCSGDELTNIDSSFEFSDSGNASCPSADGYSWHVSQLGVSCNGQILIEDYFYECSTGYGFAIDGPTDELPTAITVHKSSRESPRTGMESWSTM